MKKNPLRQMRPWFPAWIVLGLFGLATIRLPAVLGARRTGAGGASTTAQRETLYQRSTIGALVEGIFEGTLRMRELRQHGDFGLGTLNGLDGEMVQVDGQFFQVRGDGKVARVPEETRTPFACTTFFAADRTFTITQPLTFRQLVAAIEAQLPSRNLFYAIRIDGTFAAVQTRSVPRQTPPYRRLPEVTKTQATFDLRHPRGVMVGFWAPAYAAAITVPGAHFHFLTADRTAGGHVLDCTLQNVTVRIDDTPRLKLDLPGDPAFRAAVLPTDSSAVNQSEKQGER